MIITIITIIIIIIISFIIIAPAEADGTEVEYKFIVVGADGVPYALL